MFFLFLGSEVLVVYINLIVCLCLVLICDIGGVVVKGIVILSGLVLLLLVFN